MPRKPKPPQAWTDEDILRKLFPSEVRAKARREARKAADKGKNRTSRDEPKA
jgi:hypothetical protein